MESTLKKIFYKQLGNRETLPEEDEEYNEINEKFNKAYEALDNSLNEEQRELLSELYLRSGELQGAAECLYFCDGFRAGLRLGAEIFGEDEK